MRTFYGTFRSETAATRFAREVREWADSRADAGRAEVRGVCAEVFLVTKPALEFVVEDVARLSEVSFVTGNYP